MPKAPMAMIHLGGARRSIWVKLLGGLWNVEIMQEFLFRHTKLKNRSLNHIVQSAVLLTHLPSSQG